MDINSMDVQEIWDSAASHGGRVYGLVKAWRARVQPTASAIAVESWACNSRGAICKLNKFGDAIVDAG
jgi:hypothetical protein